MKMTDSYFCFLPKRIAKPARERAVNYYRDLYALYQDRVSANTLLSGSQYSYVDLGKSVLDECEKQNLLAGLDLLLIAAWAQEFDSDYASCSAYFANRYGLSGKILDICDQGSLIVFSALELLKKYLTHNAQRAALLFLEQTTIPRNTANLTAVPERDVAAIMFMQPATTDSKPAYEIISAGTLESNQKEFIAHFILNLCQLCPTHTLTIITKHVELIETNHRYKVKKIPAWPGASSWLYFLHELMQRHTKIQYGLVLDQDVETKAMGYLIIRRG